MEKKINYTISVYTENNVGLLHRLSAIFLKRHINIESFSTSESEIKDVFRFIRNFYGWPSLQHNNYAIHPIVDSLTDFNSNKASFKAKTWSALSDSSNKDVTNVG